MKKKIGISYTKTLFDNYWDWFAKNDLKDDIELIEVSFEKNNIEDIYQCDGFLLTGGIDVDPSLYNGKADYNNSPGTYQPDRDRFEEKIYRYSQINKLPLLGICRGMQLVNVLQGGKLIQDLDRQNERHKKEEKDKEHGITTAAHTMLHDIAGFGSGHVNSAHHQGVDPEAIGENLIANAHDDADKKIIEGLEFADKTGKGFMLCVQWHPERMNGKEQNPFSENIKQKFLAAIRNPGSMNSNNKKLTVINPATEEPMAALNQDNEESLQNKFELLLASQRDWSKTPLSERVQILKKFATLLEVNIETLASTLTSEMGKPTQQSRNEIKGAMTRIRWLADNSEKYLSDEVMATGAGMEETISYEPLGVICNISAWNYPYLVGVNVFVPALLAGNAVMYKPSEYATLSGVEIEKYLKQAGIPENLFHVAIGGGETGELLISLPFDGYYFTGSYKTGKYIYERVAAKMVPCQCELGGKDPLYVADDITDIKSVAAGTAEGAFYNNGQSCCAVERIYVHEKVYDEYINEFVKEVRSWNIGTPTQPGIYIGPLSRKEQLNVLEQQVGDAMTKGAELLTGGKRIIGKGYFFEPTVLVNVTHDMSLMKDESFGPLIGIMKVKDDAEAVALMQDTEYGLTAAVYSADQRRAKNILTQINAGTGYWNCCDRVSAALPWSGRKHSGVGITLSHAGLRAFVRPKGYHFKT